MAAADSHDTEALKAALAASEARASAAEAQIAALTLMIEKLRRALYGRRSERKERLLDQMELALDELTASATEDELAAEKAAARTTEVKGFVRRRPSRKPFPDHLPRERVVVPGPTSCTCCGSERLSKIGEDMTETLEVIPRRWKVIQTVREKFTCRDCERISQPPAPFHVTPRGWAGPNLLATILFEKYGQHLPLNRQRERYAREGVDLSTSTLADQVGACAVALKPLQPCLPSPPAAAGTNPLPIRSSAATRGRNRRLACRAAMAPNPVSSAAIPDRSAAAMTFSASARNFPIPFPCFDMPMPSRGPAAGSNTNHR